MLSLIPLVLGALYASETGLASLLGAPGGARAASTATLQAPDFFSPALGKEMPLKVLLPPGYSAGSRRYPVLYMLHGRRPDDAQNWEWEAYGIFDAAERLMARGEITPFIIVLPQGGQSYWMDHAAGPAWGKYLAQDVVGEVDRRYRTLSGPSFRAVGGLSMGADGALQIALNRPDVFGVAGAHSPVFRPFEEAPEFFGDRAYFDAHFPVALARIKTGVARRLILEIDVGEDDIWLGNTEAFNQELDDLGIVHEWHLWPGVHDGTYWSAHIEDYLRFYGSSFDHH